MGFSESTISIYIGNKTTMLEKIRALDALIDTMILRITEVTAGSAATIDEYWMDDGQMKVKTSYRSVQDVEAGITGLEKIRERYINQYNGRGFVLRDARGLS